MRIISLLFLALLTPMSTSLFAAEGAAAAEGEADAGHNKDYRTFHTDGTIEYGQIGDSYSAELVMYIAGNQFMVMEELIKDFQKKYPSIRTVYVETIPPGQILKTQILKQGEINGQNTAQNPDLYASVNQNHLKKLIKMNRMRKYMIYTHNKLELMVKKGNPKKIKGVEDLGRPGLLHSHPNPLTEGIFKFYGVDMLKAAGLYEKVTGGKECKECWAVPGKTWFTARHHRETPHRIETNKAHVGIVWTTEVKHAMAEGRNVEGVAIPAPLNQQDKVGYAIGALTNIRNPENAARFMAYLVTDAAQEIYAKYGFVKASSDDLKLRSLEEKTN